MSSDFVVKPVTLRSDAIGAILVRGLGITLVFASTTFAARLLGSEEYGAFSAAFSLAVLLGTLAPLGTDRIMLRNLSTSDSVNVAGRETAQTHGITAIMALGLFLLSMLAVILGDIAGISDGWQVTIFLSAVMFVPIAVTYLRQWVAIPLIGTRKALIPEQTILPLVFVVVLVVLKALNNRPTAFSAAYTYAGSMLVVWVLSLQVGILRQIYGNALSHRTGMSDLRQRVRQGLPFTGMAVGSAMLQRSLPLVIAATCGFSAAAQFSIALSFANLAGFPLGVLNLCILPRCTMLVRNSELHAAGILVSATAGWSLLLSCAIGILTCILSPPVIRLLGESYSEISLILWLLVTAAILDSLPGPSVALLQSLHLERVWSRIIATFVPLQLLTVWMASDFAGLPGAAIGYLATRALYNLLIVATVYRLRGMFIFPRFSMFRLARLQSNTQSLPPL